MATWYSDAFSSEIGASQPEAGSPPPAGAVSGPIRVARLSPPAALRNGDAFAMLPIDPRERLRGLWLTTDAGFDAPVAASVNVGLWRMHADRHLGRLIDNALFAIGLDVKATAIARLDVLVLSPTLALTDLDRMRQAWELPGIGIVASYSEPPEQTWVLGVEFATGGGVPTSTGSVMLEAEIVSG